jgi:hypothetical protein
MCFKKTTAKVQKNYELPTVNYVFFYKFLYDNPQSDTLARMGLTFVTATPTACGI